jgi:hypothetical protein
MFPEDVFSNQQIRPERPHHPRGMAELKKRMPPHGSTRSSKKDPDINKMQFTVDHDRELHTRRK